MPAVECQPLVESMRSDLKRRVEKNTVLKYQDALSPVFEAIMNSVDAIREAQNAQAAGEIWVEIEREQAQGALDFSHDINPIKSFRIRDNGIGFTDRHFEAFELADTPFKAEYGGKGVGRLIWLKAFDHAEITSVFAGTDNNNHLRTFHLCLTDKGIENHNVVDASPTAPIGTEVYLCNYKPKYQDEVPKKTEAICRRIIEHFLPYFVLGQMPQVLVLDSGENVDLQSMFSSEVDNTTQSQSSIDIKGHVFTLANYLVRPSFQSVHRLYFCVEHKMVLARPLTGKIANLIGTIRHHDTSLTHAGYVTSPYLDRYANPERTSFQISDEDTAHEPGWPTILAKTVDAASDFLEPFTQPIKKSKEERIRAFTQQTAPQYRPVVKHRPDLVDMIAPHIPDDKLDQELYRINQIYEADLRSRSAQLLTSLQSGPDDWEAFGERYNKFLEEWNEAGVAKLARHVVHRKATIDFLKASLRKLPGSGRYNRENVLHRLIFPLNSTSDDLRADQMNLWIIDEKLAYHFYLASDKQFNQQQEVIRVPSGKKPDIIVYNNPVYNNPSALVNEGQPFSSVTIIEFKRPLRDDYTDDENPIMQVYEYAEKLKSGEAIDRAGRPIRIKKDTPIYGYVLCDPTPTLAIQAKYAQLTPTPDGFGYLGYNSQYGVWIEVIFLDKLASDAEKRNAALFEQLNIPPHP